MTIGDKLVGTGYPTFNERYRKTWNGGDGKYESSGLFKEKWNSYSMIFTSESPQFGNSTVAASAGCNADHLSWDAADEFRLQSKLVEKIKGHKFNLAVDLAQANQLVTMCSKTIRMLGRSMLYLKRGNIPAALRELGVDGRNKKLKSKDVSGRWLEIQYGWAPFLGSVYESAKAFEALSQGRSNRIVVSGKKEAIFEGSCAPTFYSAPGFKQVRKRIICELTEELSFGRSLGLTNPASVVWEIVPFSFVVDWFLPIGAYLENLSVIPTLKGRFCSTLTRRSVASIGAIKNPAYSGAKRVSRSVRVDRAISATLTTQRPSFVDPITAMTSKRIANAVSLVHQLLA